MGDDPSFKVLWIIFALSLFSNLIASCQKNCELALSRHSLQNKLCFSFFYCSRSIWSFSSILKFFGLHFKKLLENIIRYKQQQQKFVHSNMAHMRRRYTSLISNSWWLTSIGMMRLSGINSIVAYRMRLKKISCLCQILRHFMKQLVRL